MRTEIVERKDMPIHHRSQSHIKEMKEMKEILKHLTNRTFLEVMKEMSRGVIMSLEAVTSREVMNRSHMESSRGISMGQIHIEQSSGIPNHRMGRIRTMVTAIGLGTTRGGTMTTKKTLIGLTSREREISTTQAIILSLADFSKHSLLGQKQNCRKLTLKTVLKNWNAIWKA